MAAGKKRGAKPFGQVATPKPKQATAKDLHRAEAHGRAEQGMGSGGRPGGTKSSGGKRRTQGKPSAALESARRSGGKQAVRSTRGTR